MRRAEKANYREHRQDDADSHNRFARPVAEHPASIRLHAADMEHCFRRAAKRSAQRHDYNVPKHVAALFLLNFHSDLQTAAQAQKVLTVAQKLYTAGLKSSIIIARRQKHVKNIEIQYQIGKCVKNFSFRHIFVTFAWHTLDDKGI